MHVLPWLFQRVPTKIRSGETLPNPSSQCSTSGFRFWAMVFERLLNSLSITISRSSRLRIPMTLPFELTTGTLRTRARP